MKKFSYLLLFLSFILFNSCAEVLQLLQQSQVQKPTASVTNAKLTSLSFNKAELLLDVKVKNPNNLSIKLAALDYSFAVNDFNLVSGNQNKQMSLTARDSSIISLPVSVEYKELYNSIKSLTEKDSTLYNFSAGFSFDVPVLGQVRVPVSKSGVLPLLRLPKISVEKLSLKNVSWTGAEMRLDVAITSLGGLDLFVDKLDYTLSINGKQWLQSTLQKNVDLSQEGKNILSIPFKLDFLEMGRAAYNTLMGNEALDYDFSGTINLGSKHPLLKDASFDFSDLSSIKLWK